MKKNRKVVLSVIIVVIAFVIFIAIKPDNVTNYSEKYAGVDLTPDVDSVSRKNTYAQYLEGHKDVVYQRWILMWIFLAMMKAKM